MRILHVTDVYRPQLGGIEVFVEDLAHRQAAAGHDVSVLTATGPARPDGESSDAGPVRVVRSRPTLRHPLAPGLARQTALAGPYDVVHAHLSVLSLFSTALARATDEAGIPTVNTVHSMWRSRRAVLRTVRVLADWDRSNAAWTTVSHAAAADMHDLLRPGVEVHVVPNAVDVAWWRAVPHRGRADAVTVVSVMRLAGRKRPFALLDMLARVRANLPATVPLRAVIVGDGPLGSRLHAHIVARGLQDWITLAGTLTRDEIRALYRSADVYVSPAHEESFGIAALEARAAGLPVVAMRSGGVGEFVEHGVEGLLCGDDDAMVAGLTTLVTDTALRSDMALHNTAHPPAQDWPHTLAGFGDVYRRVQRAHDVHRWPAAATAPR
jgi:phosphatidylinositol alpha 1,6-mannosyltransferase